jgi:hypothetical protein
MTVDADLWWGHGPLLDRSPIAPAGWHGPLICKVRRCAAASIFDEHPWLFQLEGTGWLLSVNRLVFRTVAESDLWNSHDEFFVLVHFVEEAWARKGEPGVWEGEFSSDGPTSLYGGGIFDDDGGIFSGTDPAPPDTRPIILGALTVQELVAAFEREVLE